MTDEEEKLRDKIIGVLNKNFNGEVEVTPVCTSEDGFEVELPQELCEMFNDIVTQAVIPYFADALIAAGLDFKENFVFRLDWYDYYQAEQAKRLRAEHRAEVAERAFKKFTQYCTETVPYFIHKNKSFNPIFAQTLYNQWIESAEKELEGKDQ